MDAMATVNPDSWRHVNTCTFDLILQDLEQELKDEGCTAYKNHRQSFLRLLPPLAHVKVVIDTLGVSQRKIEKLLQSSHWKTCTQMLYSLYQRCAMAKTDSRYHLELRFVTSSLLNHEAFLLMARPACASYRAAVTMDLQEGDGTYPARLAHFPHGFPLEWAGSLHLSAPASALHLVSLAQNVTTLCVSPLMGDHRDTHLLGSCLKSLALSLEGLELENAGFSAQEDPDLPCELPKLKTVRSSGGWISYVSNLIRKTRLPALKCLNVSILGGKRFEDYLSLHPAIHQLAALDGPVARQCHDRRCSLALDCNDLLYLAPSMDRMTPLLVACGLVVELACRGFNNAHGITAIAPRTLLDTHSLAGALPSEWRAAIKILTVEVGSNTISRPEGGDRLSFSNLKSLEMEIASDTRTWSTHIVHQFVACSAPKLESIYIIDSSEADVLARFIHFLTLYLPLWPRLESISIYATHIDNPAVQTDLSALSDACDARAVSLHFESSE